VEKIIFMQAIICQLAGSSLYMQIPDFKQAINSQTAFHQPIGLGKQVI
jgi:hypothetical protein